MYKEAAPWTGTITSIQSVTASGSQTFTSTKGPGPSYLSDDAQLRRLGKRPRLNRSFGFMSILGFSCSALLSWEGVLVISVPGLLNGGPAGVIWGFLINWIGTISVSATLAELASIAPTAGGQYHWVALLAPESSRNFLAYITAWLTTIAWQAMAVSTGYIIATMLQGIIVLASLDHPYTPKSWQTVLILWAAVLVSVTINSTTSRALARFEGIILILHLAGFFGVLVPLVYFSEPHNDPQTVFTTFINEGGWPTQALSFCVGFPSLAATLIGADGAVHMSEEIQSAGAVVPRALIYTVFINGSLALGMLIALMFCLTDLPAALAATETMFYPFLQIFYSAMGSATGACLVAGIVLALALASSVSIYASASRMLWSFARDQGLPFHQNLVKLSKSSLPVPAILTTLFITMLFSLIALGSTVALAALLSLVISALYSSYLLVCGMLLWRRLSTGQNGIQPHISGADMLDLGYLTWGVWRLPEPLGTANNVVAVLYSLFLLFWSFWPPTTPTTPETANWSILVFGSVVVFSVVWYFARAKQYFKGPVREA